MAWVFVEHYYQRNLANKIDGKADFHYGGTTQHTLLQSTDIFMARIAAMSLA